ncbi:low molecular weight phosphotyrosine protein phosphatase [Paucibacter sp. DJ1R-11]|uniref:low molecular weight protein-tyrosine-phosphatase n=1 Tax=Paucibacter sp. DJ1R-11 TaxID=2893556 RepID=UPI0021E4051F|nr:low molecular weight protein-tyrosine-phosphatase [Paucibacter sp. DJ1R-11]MCV2364842.1 low molecular weight phosphotyrosine protein phosphatase [Paucibacter sp. DJ1R-11]
MPAVLFVCTANICRSPMAEALLKARRAGFGPGADAAFVDVASAGVHAGPRGEPADKRAAAALERVRLGIDKKWRSRRVRAEDFQRYELILAMETDNLVALRKICPPELQHRLHLFMDLVPGMAGQDVPDPYFGPASGFDQVLMLLERGLVTLGQAWRKGALPRA